MVVVTIIELSLGTRQSDPLGCLLIILAHCQAFINTITWAFNYVFPSLMDDIHIMGPMSEIFCAFDHHLTQSALMGLRVKVSKCKLWNPSGLFLGI